MSGTGDTLSAGLSLGKGQDGMKREGPDGRWMLERIYPRAVTLDMYLEVWLRDIVSAAPGCSSAAAISKFGGPMAYLSRHEDSSEFKKMLKETLVAFCPPVGVLGEDEDHASLPRHASLQNRWSMSDLLDRVVKALLRSSSTGQGSNGSGYYTAQGDDPRRNVLSLGCRVADPHATSELLSVQGVACAFPNTTVNVIRSPPWELLLSRIGDDLMFALLRQHALLHRLPNRCFMQLAGRPVSDLCRHLGLAAGTLSTSSQATPRAHVTGASNPPLATNKPSAMRAEEDQRRSSPPTSALTSPALCRAAPSLPVASGASAAPVISDQQAGSATQGAKAPRGDSRSRVRPVQTIPRQRIFYSSTFVRRAGFPRGHFLNSSYQPSASIPSEGGTPTPTIQLARRLAADLFDDQDKDAPGARHSGETTAATSTDGAMNAKVGLLQRTGPMSSGSTAVPAAKGAENSRGRRLPKRVRRAVPLLEEMIGRARRCNFGRLLESHCPLPPSLRKGKGPHAAINGGVRTGDKVPTRVEYGPSPSDASTLHDMGRGEGGTSNNAWSQPDITLGEDSVNADVEGSSGGDETGESVHSGRTIADVWSSQSSSAWYASQDASGSCSPISISAEANKGILDDFVLDREMDNDVADDPGGVHDAAAGGPARRETVHGSPFCFDADMTFMEMATEKRRVIDFLCQACHRIFPSELWGSKRNMVSLTRAIERFVVLRRHETMLVSEVTAGMRTSDFGWMSLHDGGNDGAEATRIKKRIRRADGERGVVVRDQASASTKMISTAIDAPAQVNGDDPSGDGPCVTGSARIDRPVGCKDDGNTQANAGTLNTGNNAYIHNCESLRDHGLGADGMAPRAKHKGRQKAKTHGRRSGLRTAESKQNEEGEDGKPLEAGRPHGVKRGRRRNAPSDLAKRTQLLDALVVWTFKEVIVPLLRSLFYVTECETASQEVFFFRKPVWAKFRAASLKHLTARQYRRITTQEAFRTGNGDGDHDDNCDDTATGNPCFHVRQATSSCTHEANPSKTGGVHPPGRGGAAWAFPVSGVRLVPKANGVRAITNLSKRAWADRECVQWVKGVPLPKAPTLQRATSNASLQSNTTGASKETRGTSARGGTDAATGGGTVAALGTTTPAAGGQARRVRGGSAAGAGGVNGTASRVLMPSTNMQLSNAFHVLKHEYLCKPSLVGAGVFGLDDVFARIKPFVSRNLRCTSSPLHPHPNDASYPDGRDAYNGSQEHPTRIGDDYNGSGKAGDPLQRETFSQSRPTGRRSECPKPSQAAQHCVSSPNQDSCKAKARTDEAGRSPADCPHQRQELRDGTGASTSSNKMAVDELGEGVAGGGGVRQTRQRKLPQMYFASVDIKHCFDTVDQARLMEIIQPLLASEDYVVQKYTKTHPFKAMGRVQVSHVKEALSMEDMSQFQTRSEALAEESVDTIFTDQVVYGMVSRVDVLDMIEDHITHNIVRVPAAGRSGKSVYFQQAVGIPQGSVLSGLLCNYFFGHIEKRLLRNALETPLHRAPPPGKHVQTPAPAVVGSDDDEDDGMRDGTTRCGKGHRRSAAKIGRDERHCGWRLQKDDEERLPYSDFMEWDCGGGDGAPPSSGASGPFSDPTGDFTLLRQVDDFLLITTSKTKAEAFVRVMHDKDQTGAWGFAVHEAKTLVNFDMTTADGGSGPSARPVRRNEGRMFPWCGLRFDTTTCEVMADYSRFSKFGVSESVTVESRRPGACLTKRMKGFMSPKCHALMLDEGPGGINSRHTVLLNVYEMLLLCAAKTAASALRLPRGVSVATQADGMPLFSCGALETTAYAYSLIQSRSNRRKGGFGTSKALRCVCKMHRFEVTWLGLYAFKEIFDAFSTKHRGFARPKLDMQRALLEAEGTRAGGERKRGDRGPVEDRPAVRKTASGSRRSGAYGRLRRVVRSPDALSLLGTLTS